jgi:hypothetical protein
VLIEKPSTEAIGTGFARERNRQVGAHAGGGSASTLGLSDRLRQQRLIVRG